MREIREGGKPFKKGVNNGLKEIGVGVNISDMKKRLLNKYLKGWKDVAKIETLELRRTPLRFKFKQIISVFQLGVGLNVVKNNVTDSDVAGVRSRWCILKAGY